MNAIGETLGVARSNVAASAQKRVAASPVHLGRPPAPDADLAARIRAVIGELPTYGVTGGSMRSCGARRGPRGLPHPTKSASIASCATTASSFSAIRARTRPSVMTGASRSTARTSDGALTHSMSAATTTRRSGSLFALDCCDQEGEPRPAIGPSDDGERLRRDDGRHQRGGRGRTS